MRSTVTFRELEAFLHLAEQLNFRVAAERACVSQPALTRTIQSIEEKLDARLFDRNTRRVELTSPGRELLPIAKRILADFNGSLGDLSDYIAGRKGNIGVACLPSAAATLLPPVLAALQKSHPLLTVSLNPTSASYLEELVTEASVDFAISTSQSEGPNFVYEPLLFDPFVLICSAKDARATMLDEDEILRTRPLIASGSGSSIRPIVDAMLERLAHRTTPRYEIANISVLGGLVAAGVGVAIVPSMTLHLMDRQQVQVLPLRHYAMRRDLGILLRKGRSLSTAAQVFLDALRAEAVMYCASEGSMCSLH